MATGAAGPITGKESLVIMQGEQQVVVAGDQVPSFFGALGGDPTARLRTSPKSYNLVAGGAVFDNPSELAELNNANTPADRKTEITAKRNAVALANTNLVKAAFATGYTEVYSTAKRSDAIRFDTDPANGLAVPDRCALKVDSAVGLTGTGIPIGDESKVWINTLDTNGSASFSMIRATNKAGMQVLIEVVKNSSKNVLSFDTCADFDVHVGRAADIGIAAGLSAPTEGSLFYGPNCKRGRVEIDFAQRIWGQGVVNCLNPEDMTFILNVRDTRYRGVNLGGTPVGRTRILRSIFTRMGALGIGLPTDANGNLNGVGAQAGFVPGALDPRLVQFIGVIVNDYGENAFEGSMTLDGFEISCSSAFDSGLATLNPACLYTNNGMTLRKGSIRSPRGPAIKAGGGSGATGVCKNFRADGVDIVDPRASGVSGYPPAFVNLQPNGSGNIGSDLAITGGVMTDSTGGVTTGISVAATGGATMDATRNFVTGVASNVTTHNVPAGYYARNSWQA